MLSYLSAFSAGILTFISPCILPLIPGYLSFISGLSLNDLKTNSSKALLNTVLFTAGFSLVFIILGASATLLGKFLLNNLRLLSKIGGIIIIIFGLQIAGIFQLKFLNFEKRFHLHNLKTNLWSSFLIGILFGLGWSPCIGPILGSILLIASNQATVLQGIVLLAFYSLGLSLPFIITALAVNKFLSFFNFIKRYFRAIEITAGSLLILMGVLMVFGQLEKFNFILPK